MIRPPPMPELVRNRGTRKWGPKVDPPVSENPVWHRRFGSGKWTRFSVSGDAIWRNPGSDFLVNRMHHQKGHPDQCLTKFSCRGREGDHRQLHVGMQTEMNNDDKDAARFLSCRTAGIDTLRSYAIWLCTWTIYWSNWITCTCPHWI